MPNHDFFTSRNVYVNLRCIALIRLEISRKTRWWYLKTVIVYVARDITAFVMYCINAESGSSLLIESTDSMIWCIQRGRDVSAKLPYCVGFELKDQE